MRKVVWAMGPGIGKALALILALRSPELRMPGVSAVEGSAFVETTSANVLVVLEYVGAREISVVMGRRGE